MASSRHYPHKLSCRRSAATLLLLGLGSVPVFAKGPELSAIEVYPRGSGQAYVEIADFTLNVKNEVHPCSVGQTISKGGYGKLAKISLAPDMVLERRSDGVLVLSVGNGPQECVVPANLKLEKSEGATPSELADQADINGTIQLASDGSTTTIPRLAPGVMIVLRDKLDTELAEYLLAQRSGTISAWKAYLGKYEKSPTGGHVAQAKPALAVLYVQEGQSELAAYQASVKAAQPNYEKLQAAKFSLDAAIVIAPSNPQTETLEKGIDEESNTLNREGLGEIELYRQALDKQASGYSHLVKAHTLSQLTLNLDPKSAETTALVSACTRETTQLDHDLFDSASKLSARRPDEAYEAIKPLRPFAAEYPRVQDALRAVYAYYVQEGKNAGAKGDPQAEVESFRKAEAIEPTAEIAELLKIAAQQAQESTDNAATRNALNLSAGAEQDNDLVKAYDVLADLTPGQQKQKEVAERMEALKAGYLQNAPKLAKKLEMTYSPINGPSSEAGMVRAYNLESRCFALTHDSANEEQMRVFGHRLSDYYMAQAKHYLDRPNGIGANVGYNYLNEALSYNREDGGHVREELARARPVWQMRGSLSILVRFSGQGSREADKLAAWLAGSLVTDLEPQGLNVKMVGPNETTAVPPNFTLVGEVRNYSKVVIPQLVSKPSTYRSAQPVDNEEWVAANDEVERAKRALETANAALQGAEAGGKKKRIEEERAHANEARNKVDVAEHKRNALQRTHPADAEVKYNYTERIDDLKVNIDLQFKIVDMAGEVVVANIPISTPREKEIVTLEGVRPDDTAATRLAPDALTEAQFVDQVEEEARKRLIEQAKAQVAALPELVFESAKAKMNEGDTEGAAELYMLYLGSAGTPPMQQKAAAQKFLLDNYNFRTFGDPARHDSPGGLNDETSMR